MKRNWKRTYPHSLRNAMELCVEHAREKKNLSVERIADLMGLESHHVLYKWMNSGRLPSILIRPFEYACGIDFVTQYLAHSNNKLLISIPTGKAAEHKDISALSVAMHETGLLLAQFYSGAAKQDDVIATITTLMEDLAWQRCNIEKQGQPELEFGA